MIKEENETYGYSISALCKLGDVSRVAYYKWLHRMILDLYDRRIVSYVIRDNNNNALVYHTFDKAIESNPNAHQLCHSDRGFQYTNRAFHTKLQG